MIWSSLQLITKQWIITQQFTDLCMNVYNLSHSLTKPTKWLCIQRRLRPVWASAIAFRMRKHWVLSFLLSAQRRQIRPGRYAHMTFCWYQLYYYYNICLELQLTSQGQKSSLGVKGFNFLLQSLNNPLTVNYYYKMFLSSYNYSAAEDDVESKRFITVVCTVLELSHFKHLLEETGFPDRNCYLKCWNRGRNWSVSTRYRVVHFSVRWLN